MYFEDTFRDDLFEVNECELSFEYNKNENRSKVRISAGFDKFISTAICIRQLENPFLRLERVEESAKK